MKVVISGLGKMGMQIAQKLAEGGHQVIAHNRSVEKVEEAKKFGAIPAQTIEEAVEACGNEPAVVWIMVPAGVVDIVIDNWLSLLPKGSILVDGGNSDFRNDAMRVERVLAKGVELLDVGTSGGVHGYNRGFCMMVGGSESAYKKISSILDTLAAPSGTHNYFGKNGAGHYVKMVHNAIEYGMMQSLAEGYRMLKEGPIEDIGLAKAGRTWQKSSVITSWLNELTAEALEESPELEGIPGVVVESGEARWTLETAEALDISLPAIQAAFDVRLNSQNGEVDFSTKLLAAMRNKFGGHDLAGR
ncbi:decarboxylating 6-phosphogluconate dehydrogenase [Candidatus Saccharibacteria bacterium]|jgi:6-phosphogluconate dehydrogenase|nr:decarboxylating 6-phosphogluconate dehydrogenase [Candidatus Saccharibacteria bacterium]